MPPRANTSEKSDDEKLLIAVLSQWNPLPPVDYRKLAEALEVRPGIAQVRWYRFKARLFKNNKDRSQVEQEKNNSLGVGHAAAVNDKQKNNRGGGRKRAAVKGGSDEPPTQRKRVDKSIAMSLNAATSKPGPGKGTNNDKGRLDGLDGNVKEENDQFEDDIEWLQIGEDGNELDGWSSGDEA
ncbi:e2948eb5-d73f-4d9e-aeee-0337c5ba6026 [Sclerotinia trifoliorum]|uniref:E2948eb5-d73f-4d9e-aeee-0337c5ba6026 n=1 Tax=Sclerotinia trifoliorum TaxID=28548 RepID=A0A8H2VMD2_9HELO|nr:e2948eb5-d73f-4d9e-aeee-0337c5ba6026 [Sclerotinia trifoliorum]